MSVQREKCIGGEQFGVETEKLITRDTTSANIELEKRSHTVCFPNTVRSSGSTQNQDNH